MSPGTTSRTRVRPPLKLHRYAPISLLSSSTLPQAFLYLQWNAQEECSSLVVRDFRTFRRAVHNLEKLVSVILRRVASSFASLIGSSVGIWEMDGRFFFFRGLLEICQYASLAMQNINVSLRDSLQIVAQER